MTNSSGEIVSVQVDPEGRPFFYISRSRAPAISQALRWAGFRPQGASGAVSVMEGDTLEDREELLVLDRDTDADALQDELDELSWAGDRVVREVHP